MSGGQINATELIGSLICRKSSIVEGIRYAQEVVDGSLSLLIMTKDGIYAARDLHGRTPAVIGKKEDAYCVSFENFAYLNLGYAHMTGNLDQVKSYMSRRRAWRLSYSLRRR